MLREGVRVSGRGARKGREGARKGTPPPDPGGGVRTVRAYLLWQLFLRTSYQTMPGAWNRTAKHWFLLAASRTL
ncbi:hypothetical protein GCM10022419_097030 [Nonomuraea rosea]|uniref:Transposase n=1 Tax=Nonomuraea rosea TaxID=638574 RepID=A0ABP6Z5P7_9ACTN